MRPTLAYTVSTETPAAAAIAATVVPAYPVVVNSPRAARSTASRVARACASRAGER